jgi:metallo-beta-lactamase class B
MRWISGSMALALAACTPVAPDSPAASPPPPDTAKADVLDSISNLVDDEIPEQLDWRQNFPSWYAPVEPYRIIGSGKTGIYYVGTEGLGIYFIPTSAGHILIDGGMPGEGQYVADAIRKLGFDPKDIRILLNSHAHLDHSGGLAELKALTGAQMIASEGDRSALEGGFRRPAGVECAAGQGRPDDCRRRDADPRRCHADRPYHAGPQPRLHQLDNAGRAGRQDLSGAVLLFRHGRRQPADRPTAI